MVYDWANSAFFTVVIGVLIGPYLLNLAQNAVGENGVILDLLFFKVTPKGLPAFCTAIAVISMVIFLPILGAIADYTRLKKAMMAAFCYAGVIAGALLFFVTESYVACSILFIVANMTFAAANVFYNAFLIDITTEDKRDRVSSYGYGLGYLSGFIVLIMNLVFLNYAESWFGITTGMAVRISFLAASLWWGLFALITFRLVRTRGTDKQIPHEKNIVTVGFAEVWQTFKELRRLRYTMLFLIAYLFYNDGIQTVILQASVFMSYELFTSKGLPADNAFLIIIFGIAQISAFAGAIIFERVARYIGAKRTIILSLSHLVRDRHLCLWLFCDGDTRLHTWIVHRSRPWQRTGAIAFAVFSDDTGGPGIVILRFVRDLRERNFLDGTTDVCDHSRSNGFVSPCDPRPDRLLYRRQSGPAVH